MRRWPLLVLILAPLLALWPGLTGLAVGPFDQIRQMAPWNGPKPSQAWDVLMADSVLQSHTWRTMVFDAWGKGQLPLWNPYEFAGTPLLANSQSGGFYPPHILLGILHIPAGFGGFLLAWFHLALAGLGCYALVRKLGGSVPGAVTSGLLFTLSPFVLGWTPLSSVPATVAWLPLALACVADVQNRRSWVALTLCVAMMALAGHLQFFAYGVGAIALFSIFRRATKQATYSSGIAVGLALGLGFCLAAPQLSPVLNYSKESHRRNTASEEGYNSYVGSALQPFELANLGYPQSLGSPREPVDVGGTTIAAYWPPLVKPGANFAESAVSIGVLGLALLFAAPWKRKETWGLAAMGLLALLLAFGTPLNRLLYFYIPGWSSTGSPARVEILFVLSASILAGLAADRLADKKAQIAAGLGLLATLVTAFVLPGLANAQGAAVALRGAATAGAMPFLLLSLVATAAALLLTKRSPWSIPAGVVVVALLGGAYNLVPFGEPLTPPKVDPNTRIAVVNDVWDIVTAQPAVLPPNLAALGGIHELSGYDSLTSIEAVNLLKTVNGGTDPSPPVNGNMMFVKPTADPKALADAGVTEVWSRKPLPQLGIPEARDGYQVYRLNGPGRITGGTVQDGYDRLTVTPAAGANSVVLRDRLTKGWLDAAQNGLLEHKIETPNGQPTILRYAAPGLGLGLAVAVVALIALIAASLVWKRRETPEADV